jgi:hypothetical protein
MDCVYNFKDYFVKFVYVMDKFFVENVFVIANNFLSAYGGLNLLAKCTYKAKLLSHNLPEYYRIILENWSEVSNIGCDIDEFMNNSSITIQNKIIV